MVYFVCLLKTGRRLEERGSEAHCQEAEPQPGREQRLRAELKRDLWGVHIRAWHQYTKEAGWKEGSAGPGAKASRGFEPRSLDSESRVLIVTPRGQVHMFVAIGEVSQGLECSSMHEHALLAGQ